MEEVRLWSVYVLRDKLLRLKPLSHGLTNPGQTWVRTGISCSHGPVNSG